MTVMPGKPQILDVVHFQGFATVTLCCPMCTDLRSVTVSDSDFTRYAHGYLVQEAFPSLTDEERELFVTGVCGTCWDLMFGDDY